MKSTTTDNKSGNNKVLLYQIVYEIEFSLDRFLLQVTGHTGHCFINTEKNQTLTQH